MSEDILVLGATGQVGGATISALLERSAGRIIAGVRDPRAARSRLPEEIESPVSSH